MGGKTAPDFQLRRNIHEVSRIPVLVRIAENKVKRTLQFFDQIMCIGKPGIYVALMEAAETKLRSLGCPKVNLRVRSSNQAVIDFYERLGYSIEERASMGKQLD